MSCEISITTQIHPITEKILKGELKLSEITLEQFREGREIYPTASQAKKKGFEAHHIVPRSLQKKASVLDDRCIRYTSFEHIIDHFLMAKEDNKYLHSFECMTSFNFHNIMNNEKEILNGCIEYAKLREAGIEKIRESGKGNKNALGHKLSNESKQKISIANKGKPGNRKGVPMPDNVKEILAQRNKGNHYHTGHKHSEETRKKMSEAAKHRPKRTFSEESKRKMSEVRKGWKPSEETRKKMSEAKKGKPTWNKGLKGKYHSSKNNESN